MITQEMIEEFAEAHAGYHSTDPTFQISRKSFIDGAKWMQSEQSAELSRLRSALTEIANMRGSDQLHRSWGIAVKGLNP